MKNVPFRSIVAVVLSAVMLLAFQSCKSQYELMLESHDVPAKYKMAFDLFDAGKYAKAAGMFESLKIAVGGTAQDDTVQYYTAYSHYWTIPFSTTLRIPITAMGIWLQRSRLLSLLSMCIRGVRLQTKPVLCIWTACTAARIATNWIRLLPIRPSRPLPII